MTERAKPTQKDIMKTNGKCESPRKHTILPDDEFGKILGDAQDVWRKLGVDPLSFVTNSDNLLEMNQNGRGDEIRKTATSYKQIEETLPVKAEPSFCYLPVHLEPHLDAMAEVWKINHLATDKHIELASQEVRIRNQMGLGEHLQKIFQAIPAITRETIQNALYIVPSPIPTPVTV